MTPQIRLSKQNLADWKCIREIGEARLNQVVAKAEQLPPAPLRPTELSSLINAALDGNSEHSQVLLRQLLSLHGMRRQLGLDDKDVFFGLDSGLREAGWEEEELKKWESVSGIFKKLFSLPVVQLSAKALDLSYVIEQLKESGASLEHIRKVEAEVGTVRYRPEDVAGASAAKVIPATFEMANHAAQEILVLLKDNNLFK